MRQSDNKLQTDYVGTKTRQTRHWDWDYMTMKQIEALVHTTKRSTSKRIIHAPFRAPTRRSTDQHQQNRTWAISLIIECPMGEPLENCLARDVRGLPLSHIVGFVDDMTEEQLNRFIDHHRRCLREREGHDVGNGQRKNKQP